MDLFHIIEDCQIITRSKGVYKQVKVYRRGNTLYAAHGSGFIGLLAGGGTTHPDVSWVEIDANDMIKLEGGEFNAPVFLPPPAEAPKQIENKK